MGLLANVFVSFLALGGAHAASAVVDLIPSNFDDVVLKSGKPALVEFFAPWCGHCKTLAPIYEELGQAFAHAGKQVTIAKVDADANRELGQRFGVQGFPTLKWFDGKSETPVDYNSGRDLESLSAFVTEKTGVKSKNNKAPSAVTMLTDRSFKESVGKDKNVLVAFTAPWCGHCKTLAPIWEDLASTFASESNVLIAKVDAEAGNSKRTAEDFKIQGYPTIKFFPAGSTEAEDYSGGRTEEAFVEYINGKAGTSRAPGGGLSLTAGTIAAVDSVVSSIISTGKDWKEAADEVVAEAMKAADKTAAEYYSKVANKLRTNQGFVEKELGRLQGILAKGGLAPAKRDELTKRSNILSKFKQAVGLEEDKTEL